jgi:NAD(P)-dependent dehydrogenase (short-subunit alcohol dehydrogenase family)
MLTANAPTHCCNKQAQGGEAHGISADVGKDSDNKRIVDQTMEKYGRLDVSFINAGIADKAPFSEVNTQITMSRTHTHLAVCVC